MHMKASLLHMVTSTHSLRENPECHVFFSDHKRCEYNKFKQQWVLVDRSESAQARLTWAWFLYRRARTKRPWNRYKDALDKAGLCLHCSFFGCDDKSLQCWAGPGAPWWQVSQAGGQQGQSKACPVLRVTFATLRHCPCSPSVPRIRLQLH